jgi:hypothetical protein
MEHFSTDSNSATKHTDRGSIDCSTDGEIGLFVEDYAEIVIKNHVNTASRPNFSLSLRRVMPNWTVHRPLVQDQFAYEQDIPSVTENEQEWRLLHDDLLRRTTRSWPGPWPAEQEAQTVLLDAVTREGQARVQYYMARGRSIHFAGLSRQPPYRSNIHKACRCTSNRIDRILDGRPSGCRCDIGHSPLSIRALRTPLHRAFDILQVVALLEAYWKTLWGTESKLLRGWV